MNAHVTPPRAGDYMYTLTGTYWPLDPRAEEVRIEDIAHHLAFQCRYNGACTDYLSVAEHSYWCSYDVPAEHALEALLHDAAEAYIGDMIRPLKRQVMFKEPYLEIEGLNERVIAERFQLVWPWPASVKAADEAVCAAEVRQLIFSAAPNYCVDESRVADTAFACWSPTQARLKFMQRFHELKRCD